MLPSRISLLSRFLLILLALSSLVFFNAYYGGDRKPSDVVSKNLNIETEILYHQWHHPVCGCARYFHPEMTFTNTSQHPRSICGPAADARGPNQRVLSFTFFGNVKSSYFLGVEINAKVIAKLYPGWIMRLYHDISPINGTGKADLCSVICSQPHLDDCYVPDLEYRFKGISSKHGVFWRFSALADPLVDVTLCRDLDSTVYQREVDAVNEWLISNKTWHVMRDHMWHRDEMLAGMWGVKNSVNRSEIAALGELLLTTSIKKEYFDDQILLKRFVFPKAFYDMVAHDSFLCKKFNNTVPFPTRRNNFTFVGDKPYLSITKECPIECRPKAHQDWLYC